LIDKPHQNGGNGSRTAAGKPVRPIKAGKAGKDGSRRPRGRSSRRRELLELLFASSWPWGIVCTLLLTVLIAPGLSFHPPRYELGAIASVDVRAPYDFSYEDEVTTRARREEASAQVPEVHDFNNRAALSARTRIAAGFAQGREWLAGNDAADEAERAELFDPIRATFEVPITEADFDFLVASEFDPSIESALATTVAGMLQREIVDNKERLLAAGRPIMRRDAISDSGVLVRDFARIFTVEQARRELEERAALLTDLEPAVRSKVARLGESFIEPTLTFNFAETQRRRQQARERVDPVYFQIQKGKVLVRAGDEVDETVLRQLEVLSQAEGGWSLAGALGALILSALLFFGLWQLIRPARSTIAWKRRSFAMVGLIVVVQLALARVIFFVASTVAEEIVQPPFNNIGSYQYLIPLAVVAVLVSLLDNAQTALVASVVFSIAHGLMTGNMQLAVFSLLSCLGAILGMNQYKQRSALMKTGVFIGGVNLVVVAAIDLLSGNYTPISNFGFDLACAFVGGLGVSFVVSFFLPALESLFDRTTDIKLLELSNNNIPMLRALALEAPGTYHHSVVVGSLAEAAAETIGANAVFCRTAALYHDIGKLKKVDYFVENQYGGANRHDKLSPQMSALIIASHVKEGIEMAKEMNLPPEIIDIIPQHHGTKLITYFYEKAKESRDPELGEVGEEEFRYPGPKPQTKEAGIIMIADATEAASRTLEDPSPARLKGVIRQIIDYIFLDGQLDECDLTLRDLEKISQAFLRVLMGIYHHRVNYPGFDFEKTVEPVVVQDSR
jgi:putative nucleotidyltransferase with HDIG domain